MSPPEGEQQQQQHSHVHFKSQMTAATSSLSLENQNREVGAAAHDGRDFRLGGNPAPGDGTGADNPGYHLRWSRLYKRVEVKDDPNAGGLMSRRSISASFHAGKKSVHGGHSTKVILEHVSGSAAPGEVLACMGPR